MKSMLPIIDRIAGWLLAIGALLHGYGSYLAYPSLSANLVWAWSGSVAALLLAAINLLRVNRPDDRALAWISLAGCLLWIGIVGAFAATLPNPARPTAALSSRCDPRFSGVQSAHGVAPVTV